MSYQVHLDIFEGPFDLLLHLIERSELDIYDIPIARITAEFLDYLRTMEMLNLHVASDFLVVAATLMQIKVKMLLPKPVVHSEEEEPEEDPRRELVDKLLEYKRFKGLSLELKAREEEFARVFERVPDDSAERVVISDVDPLKGLSVWDLLEAFRNILDAQGPDEEPAAVPKEEISIRQRMREILALVRERGKVRFTEVFGTGSTRVALITGFMGLLELMRLRHVRVIQESTFGDIWLIPGTLEGEMIEPDSGQGRG